MQRGGRGMLITIESDTLIYILLLFIGAIFMLYQLKLMLFPQMKGVVVAFEDMSPARCKTCRSTFRGRMSVAVKVRTDNGKIIDAELSPCTICLEKIRKGSRVGVTKVGSRYIAQAVVSLRGKPKP
jgi:hypothetical protein